MKAIIGVETRRYATVAIEYESEKDIPGIIKSLIETGDESLDWNAPEIDYIETLSEEHEDADASPIFDIAYEAARDDQTA